MMLFMLSLHKCSRAVVHTSLQSEAGEMTTAIAFQICKRIDIELTYTCIENNLSFAQVAVMLLCVSRRILWSLSSNVSCGTNIWKNRLLDNRKNHQGLYRSYHTVLVSKPRCGCSDEEYWWRRLSSVCAIPLRVLLPHVSAILVC
jgi:hypothetical protein